VVKTKTECGDPGMVTTTMVDGTTEVGRTTIVGDGPHECGKVTVVGRTYGVVGDGTHVHQPGVDGSTWHWHDGIVTGGMV
jgi:hypothetical protein